MSFGCGVRVLYIYTTDLHSSHYEQYKLYDYGLRGLNEILWFTSFAYLAFYWYELQADKYDDADGHRYMQTTPSELRGYAKLRRGA